MKTFWRIYTRTIVSGILQVSLLLFAAQGRAQELNAEPPSSLTLQALVARLNQVTTKEAFESLSADCASQVEATPSGIERLQIEKLHALALCNLFQYGDKSVTEKLSQLAARLRAEPLLPSFDRWQIGSLFDIAIARADVSAQSASEQRARFLAVAQGHIAEFPDVPQAYEYLLGLAESEPNGYFSKPVFSLLRSSEAAPLWVRSLADQYSSRFELIGVPLANIIPGGADVAPRQFLLPGGSPDLASTLPAPEVAQAIVYSWSVDSPITLESARKLKRFELAGFKIFGVCLDKDVVRAQDTGRDLPGLQFYDEQGIDALLARRFLFTPGFTAYLADSHGSIASVTFGLQHESFQISGE